MLWRGPTWLSILVSLNISSRTKKKPTIDDTSHKTGDSKPIKSIQMIILDWTGPSTNVFQTNVCSTSYFEFDNPVWHHSFVEIDHEIFSMNVFILLLIQEGQLLVSGENVHRVLVNCIVHVSVSLPRKCALRLFDSPDIPKLFTMDIKQQHNNNKLYVRLCSSPEPKSAEELLR